MRVAASGISTQDTSTDIAMEVTNYITMKCSCSDTEPLAFWQQHSRRFPMLCKVAELYLSMSSASVPVDAMFSTTGLILNGKRSLLAPDKLNRISFIHDNIMHTCVILNRQKKNESEWFLNLSVTFSLISLMWTICLTLTLICPASSCCVYLMTFVQYSYFQYFWDKLIFGYLHIRTSRIKFKQ